MSNHGSRIRGSRRRTTAVKKALELRFNLIVLFGLSGENDDVVVHMSRDRLPVR